MYSFTFLLALLSNCRLVNAKVSEGFIRHQTQEFMYLDRFCYQSESGVLEYHIEYPADRPREMLLLYYDTEDQWPRAYKELQTCEERVELLRNISQNNQIIYLDPYSTSESNGDSKCKLYYQADNEEWISCTGFRTFRAARSRWWFLALASCSDTDDTLMNSSNVSQYWGIYAEYKLTMTNGQPSDIFHYQFSDDEWPILPADIAFLVTNFILLAISYVVGFQLSSRRLYHSIYRIYVQSVAFETGGLILCVLHGLIYSTDGIGMSFLRQMGQLLRGIAQMMFVFMCLLLSRGLNVTRMKLGKADNCFIILMVIVFVTSYFGMLLWEIRGFDPATVYYPGESVPGYLLAVWRIVAWIFFLTASLHSAKIYPNKRAFFRNFAILLTPWFWAAPIILVFASYLLDNWVRAGVVNIVEGFVIFYGYAVFLWLARPTIGNKNFPFHIRTTQVDVGIDPNEIYASDPKNDHHWTGNESAPPNESSEGVATIKFDDQTPMHNNHFKRQ